MKIQEEEDHRQNYIRELFSQLFAIFFCVMYKMNSYICSKSTPTIFYKLQRRYQITGSSEICNFNRQTRMHASLIFFDFFPIRVALLKCTSHLLPTERQNQKNNLSQNNAFYNFRPFYVGILCTVVKSHLFAFILLQYVHPQIHLILEFTLT